MDLLSLYRQNTVKVFNPVILICVLLISPYSAFSQGESSTIMSDTLVFNPGQEDTKIILDGNLMFKTKVLYRGLVPSSGPAVAGNFWRNV